MTQDELKKQAAIAALPYIKPDMIVGIGTGSTVNAFIDVLSNSKNKPEAAVASSVDTAERLKKIHIPLIELSMTGTLPLYIDGADEINRHLQLIKGAGGALTREKIVASASRCFLCIADESKFVSLLGLRCSLPVEVIPMASSYVAREIIKLGGSSILRENFLTDNGNVILDVTNLAMYDALNLEKTLNNIAGVVSNGLFAQRRADIVLLATSAGVETYRCPV